MVDMDIDISLTIKALRQKGLTQTQIGRAMNLSQTSVSDMEAGKVGIKRPSYTAISGLIDLARAHGLLQVDKAPRRRKTYKPPSLVAKPQ